MFTKLLGVMSLGRSYLAAAAVYTGLGLLVLSTLPGETSYVKASDSYGGECGSCPTDYYCCHGLCIPYGYVCCDDGTNGPGSTCACCTGCTESCSSPSTVQCN